MLFNERGQQSLMILLHNKYWIGEVDRFETVVDQHTDKSIANHSGVNGERTAEVHASTLTCARLVQAPISSINMHTQLQKQTFVSQ